MFRRANAAVIAWTADALATSAAVWGFLALTLMPLAWAGSLAVVQFVSSAVLQLVALPVLGVQNRIEAAKLARQMAEQHAEMLALVREVRAMHGELHRAIQQGRV